MDYMTWFMTIALATCVTLVILRESLSKYTSKLRVDSPLGAQKVDAPIDSPVEGSAPVDARVEGSRVEAPMKVRLKDRELQDFPPSHQVEGIPTYVVGVRKHVDDIRRMVLKGERVIGIVGMQGIGKSTIAKLLFNQISREFEYSNFTENVQGIPLRNLDEHIRGNFYCNGTRLKTSWSDIQKKKTLIVMDDVGSLRQLHILPSLDHLRSGSCAIITSRDQRVLRLYHGISENSLVNVDFLKYDDATRLFCHHAFGQESIPQYLTSPRKDYWHQNVKRVLDKCQGLPPAITFMGGHLQRRVDDALFCDDAIDKFEKGEIFGITQDDLLWASSTMSQEEQQMFIEAATCFHEEPLELALAVWENSSEKVWNKLLDMSMVQERHKSTWDSLGEREHQCKIVWVHEHLRDLAKALSKNDVESKWKFNWLRADLSLLQFRNGDRIPDGIEIAGRFEGLRYVDLDGVGLNGEAVNDFGHHLRILRWKMRSMTQLPAIPWWKLSNLRVLELANWKVPRGFLQALNNLSELRILSLGHLEGLNHVPQNFGEGLKILQRLDLVDLSLSVFPGTSVYGPRSLRHLSLVKVNIRSLLNLGRYLGTLQTLTILGCDDLRDLAGSFHYLRSLKVLVLSWCKGLTRLPEDFGETLGRLETLTIEYCENLEALPKSFGIDLTRLKELVLRGCRQLERLPEGFGEYLHQLETLTIQDCENLQQLPTSLGSLSKLKGFVVSGCRQLKKFPESFGNLLSLQHLSLVNVNISKLESIGFLSSLVTLKVQDCENLEDMPVSFGDLNCLEGLVLRGCRQLKRLPDCFGRGMTLTIEADDQLNALSDSLRSLTSLRYLTLVNLSTLTLPDFIGHCSAVTLTIKNCEKLERLPPSILSFGHLDTSRELVFHGCRQLKTLPDKFGPHTILTIEGDDQLDALSNSLRELTSLQRLTLVNVSSLELPKSLLSSLVMLTIRSCRTLSCLPYSFQHLSSLKELYIQNCPMLSMLQRVESHDSFAKEVGDSIQHTWGWFSSLENLTMSSCCITSEILCAMLDTIVRLPETGLALKRLDLHDNLLGSEVVRILASRAVGHLQQLTELDLSLNKAMDSSGLTSLIETIQNGLLPGLQIVKWLGNLDPDATADAVAQAYYDNEALTTRFEIEWTELHDISLGAKVEQYRERNVRLKTLKEQVFKLKTEDKPTKEPRKAVPLSSAKVFLCGHPEVGKTTLRKTLHSPLISSNWFVWGYHQCFSRERRTRGIELSRIEDTEENKTRLPLVLWNVEDTEENRNRLTLVLWDLAGQEEFHILHGSFFPDLGSAGGFAGGNATTFVLVFEATFRKEVKEELKYWLGFVASSSLKHAKRHVVIVLNQFRGNHCSVDHQRYWKNLVKEFAEIFDDLLQIHSRLFVIDARVPQSVNELKAHLFNHARNLLKGVVVPEVCIRLQQELKEWAHGEKNTYHPILSWQAFEDILKSKHEGTEWSGELLRTSALYLHEIGEIVYFEIKEQTGEGSQHRSVVVPDPEWFCRHIVGELLLPEQMLEGERPITVSEYGSISMMEFTSFFTDKLTPGTRKDDVISMLEQIGLGYRKGAEEIIIPALIREDDTSKDWEDQGSLWVMGRCLAAEDQERLPIPLTVFRRLQVELAQSENFGEPNKYIAGKSSSNFTDGEHLVLVEIGLNPSNRAYGRIDILVKTDRKESEDPSVRLAQINCISGIMQKLEKLCVTYCSGVNYDIKVIEPWNAADKTPRMIDRKLISLRQIKHNWRNGQVYAAWRLNGNLMKLESFLSNSERQEVLDMKIGSPSLDFRQVNDSLYEMYRPPKGTPTMEILFFHGIQFGSSEEAHISTWESGDRSCLWPQKWLVESFPGAHILFISYRVVHGTSDMYLIKENLASDLIQGKVGQTPNCPVVMVGHCLGGLVIKDLCLHVDFLSSASKERNEKAKFQRLVENMRGIFYYSTPHRGTFLEKVAQLDVASNNLLTYFQALGKDASRLNHEFGVLRNKFPKWRIRGLGANLPTKSGPFRGDVVVPEASSREGDSFNVMPDEDHYSISKPRSKIARNFASLVSLLETILEDTEV